MIHFALNVILAVLWMAINGDFSVASLLMGFLVGYAVLVIASPLLGDARYLRKLWAALFFILYVLWELVRSSLRVAADVLRPNYQERVSPGIIAVPLDVAGDVGVTVLANVITLTPGTLTLDVSDDKRVLYVHAMYAPDPGAVRQEIKAGLERRVREVLE